MVWLLYALRVVQGLLQGVCWPSLSPLVNKWTPTSEKGLFVSIAYMGATFGTVITYPMCGLVMQSTSWTWVFYITSIITLVWFLFWILFMSDSPEEDRFLTEKEKKYILST